MITIDKSKIINYTLSGIFKSDKIKKECIKEINYITEYPLSKTAYIYLGEKKEYTICKLKKSIKKIVWSNKRGWNIDPKTFATDKVNHDKIVEHFVDKEIFLKEEIWNLKTGKNKHKKGPGIVLINSDKYKEIFKKSKMLAEAVRFARKLQAQSPNLLNSVELARSIKRHLFDEKNLSVRVLNKSEIAKNKMGLLLAVNSGSNYDPRVVVIEYIGDDKTSEKQALIGKGITFDAGGYNIKTGKYMLGMKYDMSAAAIIAAAMKSIAKAKPKKNIVAVLCITDNMVSKTSTVPDSVVTSMNGMSVEINNTDAEGRLVLADGITYAIQKCNATKILDMSTLTGAIVVALGKTYTGVWATVDSDYESIKSASIRANEKIWRMPFHEDFVEYMKKSEVADIKNTSYTGEGGSNSAAMFLKEFTNKIPYIHLDIAGTANIKENPTGCLVKTLYEFIVN